MHFLQFYKQPPTATDTVTRNGRTENVSVKIQCISAMNEYVKKSPEVNLVHDFSFALSTRYIFKFINL